MATTKNSFDVLNVSFYGSNITITFTASNWALSTNAIEITRKPVTHTKWAIKWLQKNWVKWFYSAINKLVLAWHAKALKRNEWSVSHWEFYSMNTVGWIKRDCFFVKEEGLFA